MFFKQVHLFRNVVQEWRYNVNGRLVPSVYIYITMFLRNSIRIVAVREWAYGHCGGHG